MDLRCKYSPELGVAITGATGFIGAKLLQSFGTGNFEVATVEEIGSGAVIIHLAADVSPTREGLLANIAADTYLLEMVNKKHRGLIYASSNNVYPYALDCRVNERTLCNDYYATSKIFGEQLISEWSNVPVVLVRIADVFGVGQRHGNLFKAIEQAIRTGMPLKQYGLGLKRRTYIHVEELCSMLKHIAVNNLKNSQQPLFLNLGYEDSSTVKDILEKVSKMTGLNIVTNELEVETSYFDIRTMRISNLHGYKPCWRSFSEALSSYVNQIKLDN